MSTSGSTAFSPSTGELVMQAFRRIGVPRVAITSEMLLDARNELNLLGSEWANGGPNLWAVDLVGPVALVQGQRTVALDPSTVDVLDLWLTIPNGPDRTLASIGRSDYASQADKLRQGQPSCFWLDKLTVPVLTLWPVPDGPYTLSFYRSRQIQDASLAGATTPDAPFRFLDALVWCLAERLAFLYASDKLAVVGPRAMSALALARAADTEDAPVVMAPSLAGYFR